MKELRATVLVGLLAVVSAALVLIGVLNTSKGIGGDDDTYMVFAMFDDVTGIAAGTKVTIAGFPVGEVKDIKLQGERVRVTIRLKNQVQLFTGVRAGPKAPLLSAAMVQRLQASLLGDAYLELKPGAKGTIIPPGGEIELVVLETGIAAAMKRLEGVAAKVDDAAEIIPKIKEIAADIGKITNNAAKVFGSDDGAKRFDEIANNFVKVSRDLASTTGTVKQRLTHGPLAAGGELDRTVKQFNTFAGQANQLVSKANGLVDVGGGSAKRSLANLESVTANLRRLVGQNEKGVASTVGGLDATLKKAVETLARIDRVVANLETVTGKAAKGEGSIGRLLTNDKLVKDTEVMVSQVKDFVTRFVGLKTAIDFQTNAYARRLGTDRDAWRSQVSFRIQPSAGKYYMFGVSSDVNPQYDTVEVVTTDVDGNVSVTNRRSNTISDTIKIQAQYVRRWGAVALRGGLIESRAGVGFDVFAWNDRVQLSSSLFRLTDDVPRLRASLRWAFLKWAYVQVGGDDLLTPQRDGFFGLGIAFDDNDLILLFASAPSISP